MSDDVLDLRTLAEEWKSLLPVEDDEDDRDDDHARCGALAALCGELNVEATPEALEAFGDNYEPTMILASYFQEYARELAEDIGAVPSDLKWPMYCIDWEHAARELKYDYTSVSFDGDDYYIRSW